MIRRTPKGQWCDPFSAVSHWLPELLNQSRERQFHVEPLKALARYCVGKAADAYGQAQSAYTQSNCGASDWRPQEDASASWGSHRHELAQKWLRKRDVLMRALKEIEEIK